MVRSHRCPATVSGTKSARTTEVKNLGKAQRVGVCREPGDLPDFLLGSLSRGKVPVCLVLHPNLWRLGFFYVPYWLSTVGATASAHACVGTHEGAALSSARL